MIQRLRTATKYVLQTEEKVSFVKQWLLTDSEKNLSANNLVKELKNVLPIISLLSYRKLCLQKMINVWYALRK